MDISYENQMNLAFDKPLQYKNILLYPAKLSYYSIFAVADECLDVNRLNEKNVRLLRLPYLDYMYEKSLLDNNFKAKWDMLIWILNIVLGQEQTFDIIRQQGNICIKVYQKSKDYELLNKEYTILKKTLVDGKGKMSKEDVRAMVEKAVEIKDKMYDNVLLNSNDFDYIRQLIMVQNDIKSQHYDSKTEEILNKAKEKLRESKGNDNIDFEDLITAVSYCTQISPQDMENMTIRRFHRYLNLIFSKDDYQIFKPLEASGMIKTKGEIKYWINHYEPKGKYDDVLTSSDMLASSLNKDNKI